MDDRLHVFLSSTSEMRQEREALASTLSADSYKLIRYETTSPIGERTLKFLDREIRDSHVFVLILGRTYGSLMSDGRSVVEWEFDTADHERIDILPFVKAGVTAEEAQEKFIKKVTDIRGRLRGLFANPKEFVEQASRSLEAWLIKYATRITGPAKSLKRFQIRLLFAVALVMLIGLTAVIALAGLFTKASVVGFSVIVFGVIGMIVFLTTNIMGRKY
jgi:hypothetical protein